MIEQRKYARRKTFYGAEITAEKFHGWAVDCTVKNVGLGGARIALPPRTTIPDRFTLDMPSRPAEAARLVWHRDGLVGVTFDSHQPDAIVVSHGDDIERTRLARRIAAIVGRGTTNVIPFERRAR